ncbi:hypothetical protein [Gordoniibacillus kamchatkensis]|uniref:hypothetical protein n=1 Tax=Gordoniibacillus kamchatkensis TaxID=1590651 RepID=UPI0012DFEA61|nr:hypothetical protein [Paenibacillus sp. VKM B-2647]
MKKGEVAPEQSRELVVKLIERGEQEQAELRRLIKEQLQRLLGEMNIATKEDLQRLEQRVEKLEQPS